MKSMTGYGRSVWEDGEERMEVEIRSVNGRYYNFAGKLPLSLLAYENKIKKIIGKQITRGSVTITVIHTTQNQPAMLNTELLKQYYQELIILAKELNTKPPSLNSLVNLPEIVAIPTISAPISSKKWQVFTKILEQALDQMMEMRSKEGSSIAKELEKYSHVIAKEVENIEAIVPSIAENFQTRLQNRMEEVFANNTPDIAKEDILREVAIFTERADISEEISRLKSHLAQFGQVSKKNKPIGKTLEFILQEMVRESNTIAAKANDARCSNSVVTLKTSIEKIREQLQNLE